MLNNGKVNLHIKETPALPQIVQPSHKMNGQAGKPTATIQKEVQEYWKHNSI